MTKGAGNVVSAIVDTVADKGEEAAVEFIKDKVGIDLSNKQPEEVVKEVEAIPAERITQLDVEIQKLQTEQELKRLETIQKDRELQFKEFEKEIEDVQDSRDRDEKQRATGRNFFERNVTHIFAFIGVGVIFAMVAGIVFANVPHDSQKYADIVLGTLLALATNVFNHYFGHTKSSGDKTQALIQKKG